MGSNEVAGDVDDWCSTTVAGPETDIDVSSMGLLVTRLLVCGTEFCVVNKGTIDEPAAVADIEITLSLTELRTGADDA